MNRASATIAFLVLASTLARAEDAALCPSTSSTDLLHSTAVPRSGGGVAPKVYGTTHVSKQRLGTTAFEALDSATVYAATDGNTSFTRYSSTPGNQALVAHPTLPTGARVLGVTFQVCDFHLGLNVSGLILSTDQLGQNLLLIDGVSTAAAQGCKELFLDISGKDFVVDNDANQLLVDIVLDSGDTSQSFAGATVHYVLQVSPPPLTASFNDVPTDHPFFQYVEALAASGITEGCGVATFCPGNPVTRGQMAVFLSKAQGLQFP